MLGTTVESLSLRSRLPLFCSSFFFFSSLVCDLREEVAAKLGSSPFRPFSDAKTGLHQLSGMTVLHGGKFAVCGATLATVGGSVAVLRLCSAMGLEWQLPLNVVWEHHIARS